MENFKSKYFNIDNFGSGWEKDELAPILNFLESADLITLQKIITECGIKFQDDNKNMSNKEQMIAILFGHDVQKEKLLDVLKLYGI